MLVLSRKPSESIVIDGRIIVSVLRVEGETVRLGIEAPIDIPIFRKEVYEEITASNRNATGLTRPGVEQLLKHNKPKDPHAVAPKPCS
ncbi:MAG: carbon storage regulator [Pedosphaera sp.]|nr:carbon storage regulator [Pedosphaera sp.]MST01172.1 carbon storage regulator [Pedosphaera sp.]